MLSRYKHKSEKQPHPKGLSLRSAFHHRPASLSDQRVLCWYCHVKPCPSNKWLIHNILEKTFMEHRTSLIQYYASHAENKTMPCVASWWNNPLESRPMLTYHSIHMFPRQITDWLEHHMLCRDSPKLIASITIRDYTLCVIEFPAIEPTLPAPAPRPGPRPRPRK